ncbi:U-box domain-containing protein [Xylaria sp. CBS 124048]|nr:U-box domain-containing protein [Xylaria sp. CBS 124048]
MAITQGNDGVVVTIHSLESKDAVLVKVEPPLNPQDITQHVPCDIVLVIDVSSSMDDPAPAPGHNEQGNAIKEDHGLSILDLVKHAARAIVSTLNEGDRLGVVTFGDQASVVQGLTSMTEEVKSEVNDKIDGLRAHGRTNLWGGIREGLGLFGRPGTTEDAGGSARALMVLTDGMPNHFCPPEGYARRLRSVIRSSHAPLPAIIDTFGFGYNIESGLLKSIAEASNGNFAFIPDAGMIGTVIIHAVAHLQSTYATRCVLEISAPRGVRLRSATGKCIDQPKDEGAGSTTPTIQLGNLQYTQSRDIYLENVNKRGQRTTFKLEGEDSLIKVRLTHSRMHTPDYETRAQQDLRETSPLTQGIIAYHKSRSMICKFLSSFSEVQRDLVYAYTRHGGSDDVDLSAFRQHLDALIDSIPAKDHDDAFNTSLMEDLTGQIKEALSKPEYFTQWGEHYFHSLRNAHANQLCNSFKDPGPLMYNHNVFFIRCRDLLSDAFDSLPPPPPSRIYFQWHPLTFSPPDPSISSASPDADTQAFSMSRYNSASNPCFAANSLVQLATGAVVPINQLRAGTLVRTPVGNRRVIAMLLTEVYQANMLRVGSMLVTPWHPVKSAVVGPNALSQWIFPAYITNYNVTVSGAIFSIVLEPHEDPEAHAIDMGEYWGVTLGHGVLSGLDARAHPFFGDYDAVLRELATLDSIKQGLYVCQSVRKDAKTGLVCGFEKRVLNRGS